MPKQCQLRIHRLHGADGVHIQGNFLPCCIITGKHRTQPLGTRTGNGIFTARAVTDRASFAMGPHISPGTPQNLVIGHEKVPPILDKNGIARQVPSVPGGPMLLCFHVGQSRFDKAKKQGMGPVRAALKLGVELTANKPEVARQLHHFHQVAVRGQTGQ